ncbi:hypothetical protein BVX97_03610 [bacterium E08(2017)]|nr:hypothetical protein BVX97_03610 [bacterium E08(2017)]
MIVLYDFRFLPMIIMSVWIFSLWGQVAMLFSEDPTNPLIVIPQVLAAILLLVSFFWMRARKKPILGAPARTWILLWFVVALLPAAVLLTGFLYTLITNQ